MGYVRLHYRYSYHSAVVNRDDVIVFGSVACWGAVGWGGVWCVVGCVVWCDVFGEVYRVVSRVVCHAMRHVAPL